MRRISMARIGMALGALLPLAVFIVSLRAQAPKGAAAPMPQAAVGGADFAGGGVAPAEVVSIFGAGLGPIEGIAAPAGGPVAELAGVRVTFDGVSARLYYVSAGQINLHVPPEVADLAETRIEVHFDGGMGAFTVPVLARRPALFTADGSGMGLALAFNYDGSANQPANPAAKSSRIAVYAGGLGRADNIQAIEKSMALEATVGGEPADVRAAYELPYSPGLVVVEISIPEAVAASTVSLELLVDGHRSQQGVTIAIDPDHAADAETLTHLNQGWSAAEQRWFYSTTQGSQLIPYDWFLALETPSDERLFVSDSFVDSLGYLTNPPDTTYNPDGLPIGFVKDADPETGDWLGLTCSACHTSQLNYQGTGIRIDGAPALSDFEGFYKSLLQSLENTLDDPEKWSRFVARVGEDEKGEPGEALRIQIEPFTEGLRGFVERNFGPVAYGYARLDAFGVLTNEIVGKALGRPGNVRLADAPVSYPFLWNTPRMDRVQWNGSGHNPLVRNVGEVLGVFGQLDLTGDLFLSSVDVPNLVLLEQQIDRLKAPRWPEAILGPIDREKASRGKEIFHSEAVGCANCHTTGPPYPMTEPNEYGERFISVTMVPFGAIGTDPEAILDFSLRGANTGPVADLAGGETVFAAQLAAIVFNAVINRQFNELGLSEQERVEYQAFRGNPPGALFSYKAGPLEGIWATAPYLHNGSVPNLYELLLPTEERSQTFYVGSREFDPERVGFQTDPAPRAMLLDTTQIGNSNAGHECGSDLDDEQRWELVEYLKTL